MAQLVVVLTGGIASGKTQTSNILSTLGCAVIDADVVARQVVAKDTQGWSAIVERFGQKILHQNGAVNRQALKTIVFNDANALADLNAITHPLITESIKLDIDKSDKDVVVVVVPLLTTANRHAYFDRVLVVDVKEDTQHRRLQHRDQINAEFSRKMLSAQIDRKQRLTLADDVIGNEGSLQELEESVELMHDFYVSLATSEQS